MRLSLKHKASRPIKSHLSLTVNAQELSQDSELVKEMIKVCHPNSFGLAVSFRDYFKELGRASINDEVPF